MGSQLVICIVELEKLSMYLLPEVWTGIPCAWVLVSLVSLALSELGFHSTAKAK